MPAPLRNPAFRAYWLGAMGAVGGYQTLVFGEMWLIHELTDSPLYLGYLGLAMSVPAIALNLVGGVVADKVDKRRLVVIAQVASASLAFLLAGLTLADAVQPWHVLVVAALTGAVIAFDWPARESLYPRLVESRDIVSAVALDYTVWQGTRMVMPALAGLIVAHVGTAAAFVVSGAGFLAFATVMQTLRVPAIERAAGRNPARDLADGISFLRRNSIFAFLIGMALYSSYLGMSYTVLMPVFAVDILNVGADGQGLLMSASGISSLLVTAWLGTQGTFGRRGPLLVGGAAMSGLCVASFALTARYVGSFPLALALLFAVGLFNALYTITIVTSIQAMVPNVMRGRVMSVYGLTYHMFSFGAMQAGAIASAIGAPFAVAAGGLAVTAFALGPALAHRNVRNLTAVVRNTEAAKAARPSTPQAPAG